MNAGMVVKIDSLSILMMLALELDVLAYQARCRANFLWTGSQIHNTEKYWVFTPSTVSHAISKWPTNEQQITIDKQLQCNEDTSFDNQHFYRECDGRDLCDRCTVASFGKLDPVQEQLHTRLQQVIVLFVYSHTNKYHHEHIHTHYIYIVIVCAGSICTD